MESRARIPEEEDDRIDQLVKELALRSRGLASRENYSKVVFSKRMFVSVVGEEEKEEEER